MKKIIQILNTPNKVSEKNSYIVGINEYNLLTNDLRTLECRRTKTKNWRIGSDPMLKKMRNIIVNYFETYNDNCDEGNKYI